MYGGNELQDRQCVSSQQAHRSATQTVMSGTQNVVITAGVESMSQVPIGANIVDGLRAGPGPAKILRYACEKSHSDALESNPAATMPDAATRTECLRRRREMF